LSCTNPQAKKAQENFLNSLPELKRIKESMIPRDASRGYFIGLDGRKVPCTSTHLMLSGYLQNGEAVIMKHANVRWRQELDKLGINYQQQDFVHDEWQTRVIGTYEEAEEVGRVQREALVYVGEDLGLFCPLEGESIIGKDWRECH